MTNGDLGLQEVLYNHILNLNLGGQKDSIKSNVYGLSAQAIAYYDPLDNLLFYATIGKKDNIPTIKEKYSERWGTYMPNPNLQTESALNIEIGGNYKIIENLQMIIKPIKEIDIIAGTGLSSKIYQGINQGYSPLVFLTDLKLVTRPIENFEIGLGVENLFDRNYYYYTGYNQEGRRIYMELSLKY